MIESILMSIKPKYVEKILNGEKKWEFRKRIWKRFDIERIYIYSTAPVKKIIGYFEPTTVTISSPRELWRVYSQDTGMSKEEFFKYYEDAEKGYAIVIDNLVVFDEPIDTTSFKESYAPQSWCYIRSNLKEELEKREK